MKYVCTPLEDAVSQMASQINKALSKGSVLLLLSGGSNIQTAVKIRERLILKNSLTVGLVDERYDQAGHAESNWTQLLEAGFQTDELNVIPVLEGAQIEETTKNFKQRLQNAQAESDTVIGIFGMGADGHTSGILPGSPAVYSDELVAYYQANDYNRITTTPAAFPSFDIAFLVAYGENKHRQIQDFVNNDLPIEEQPVQALKKAKKLIVYTDYGED